MNIKAIEGVGDHYASKLQAAGVRTTQGLLKRCATRKDRTQFAAQTGISEDKILEWVNRSDLMRVRGVGEEYSDLLEVAGVDTVKELRNRNPQNLHQAVLEANAIKRVVRRPPALSEIERWVAHAKTLPPIITY